MIPDYPTLLQERPGSPGLSFCMCEEYNFGMQKVLKKAGFPILVASVMGFKMAPNPGEGALFMLSLVGLVVGGILLVIGPFIGSGEKRSSSPVRVRAREGGR